MKRVPIIVEVVTYGTIRVITETDRAEFTVNHEKPCEVIDLQTLKQYEWYTDEGCGPLFIWNKFGPNDSYIPSVYNMQERDGYPIYELDINGRLNTILFLEE